LRELFLLILIKQRILDWVEEIDDDLPVYIAYLEENVPTTPPPAQHVEQSDMTALMNNLSEGLYNLTVTNDSLKKEKQATEKNLSKKTKELNDKIAENATLRKENSDLKSETMRFESTTSELNERYEYQMKQLTESYQLNLNSLNEKVFILSKLSINQLLSLTSEVLKRDFYETRSTDTDRVSGMKVSSRPKIKIFKGFAKKYHYRDENEVIILGNLIMDRNRERKNPYIDNESIAERISEVIASLSSLSADSLLTLGISEKEYKFMINVVEN
jgi:predicted RNase H-like nuclease (RuvC/YqgF family)